MDLVEKIEVNSAMVRSIRKKRDNKLVATKLNDKFNKLDFGFSFVGWIQPHVGIFIVSFL